MVVFLANSFFNVFISQIINIDIGVADSAQIKFRLQWGLYVTAHEL